MTTKDMFTGLSKPSSDTANDSTKAAPQPDARIGKHGRMTSCCGACSTIDQDTGELYCKACFKVVPEGEGDGGGRMTINIDEYHCSKMDFEGFQSTRKHVDNIAAYSQDDFSDNKCGYVYDDSFYIECQESEELRTLGHNIDHDYYLIIGSQEYCSDNLAELEAILWNDFAKGEVT